MKNQQYTPYEITQLLEKFQRTLQGQPSNQRINLHQAYNGRQRNYYQQGNKNVLLDTYKRQMPQIFSQLAANILEMQKQQPKIPILYSGKNHELNLSGKEVKYLLSLMALNLVPKQDYNKKSTFNRLSNFSYIFSNELYKTQCLMEYFKVFFNKSRSNLESKVFTLRRQVSLNNFSEILNQKGKKNMINFEMCSNSASIEDYIKKIKVDFANKYIGGGALTRGLVQEQIFFSNHPQMYISTLLCQVMRSNQSIFFCGFQKLFSNEGYSYQTKFAGKANKQYETDKYGRSKQYISAIDAIDFKNNPMAQFGQKQIQRQIHKAYTGFNLPESDSIVTGNWGCGAFKGNLSLKFLIQWIACSMAEKRMIYCPYGKKQQLLSNINSIQRLKKMSVQQTYKYVIQACKRVKHPQQNIFQKLLKKQNSYKYRNTFDQQQVYKVKKTFWDWCQLI